MADVTSTARLVVTVEGEDKVKKLAASLKALAGAGGTKKIGVGGGATGLASQMAATHIAVKRAIAPAIAAGAVTAKVMEKTAGQQAGIAKTVATMSASQAITGKLMGQIGAGQAVMAKTVAPMMAAQTAAAKLAKAMPTSLAEGMAKAQAARAAIVGRGKEVFPEQAPGPSGMTAKMIAALRKNAHAQGTDDEIRARYAKPPAAAIPFNKKELAQRAAMGVPAAGAGLAEGGGIGIGGGLARLGLGVGVVGILGGATVALTALAAAAAAVSVGAWAANKGLDEASKSAKNIWDNMGRAKAAGKTVDQLADRDALRDQLFGEKAAGLENRLPKLLTEQRQKKGIAGDKGIFGKLGLDRKTLADMEKKGEADATGVLERIGDKRAQLEDKIAAAKLPKQKAALEKQLGAFDKSMNLFLGKPLADMVRGLPRDEAKKFKNELKAVSDSFDKVVPKTTPKELEQQAARLQRAEFVAAQIAKKRDEAIGRTTTPAAARFQEAKNKITGALSPEYSQIVGNIGRLALDAGTALLGMIPTDKIKAAAGVVGNYLQNLKLEDIPGEFTKLGTLIKDKVRGAFATEDQDLWEGIKETLKGGLKSAFDNQADLWTGIGTKISSGLKAAMDSIQIGDSFTGLGKLVTDAITNAIKAAKDALGLGEKPAEPVIPRGKDELQEQPAPTQPEQTPGRFEELLELPAKASEAAQTFNDAAGSGLPGKGGEAGSAFNSSVDGNSIGSAIGNTAAGIISGTTVNVKVDVSGAVSSSVSGGGSKSGGASPGPDTTAGQ